MELRGNFREQLIDEWSYVTLSITLRHVNGRYQNSFQMIPISSPSVDTNSFNYS